MSDRQKQLGDDWAQETPLNQILAEINKAMEIKWEHQGYARKVTVTIPVEQINTLKERKVFTPRYAPEHLMAEVTCWSYILHNNLMASTGTEWEILPRYSFADVAGGLVAFGPDPEKPGTLDVQVEMDGGIAMRTMTDSEDIRKAISFTWEGSATFEGLGDAELDDIVAKKMAEPMDQNNKPCPDCGRELRYVRTLTGLLFKNGRCEVWTHVDTGYAPCNVDANGMEIAPPQEVWVLFQEVSDQYGTSEPIGLFAHELTEEERRKLSPSKRSYVKKFEVQP